MEIGNRFKNGHRWLCGVQLQSSRGRFRELQTVMPRPVDLRAQNKIITEMKKLHIQKHDVIEDASENSSAITKLNVTSNGREDGQEKTATAVNTSLPRRVRVKESQFKFLGVLGKGAYGTVSLVQKNGGADHGRLYAMKVLAKASIIKKNVIQGTITERQILEAVGHHPFITTLHYAFQTDSKLCLVLDYMCGGDLYTASLNRKFDESEVRFYIGEIILALEYLHKLGIIHRDVKLENILLDSEGHAVLSDFGLSRKFLPHEKHKAHSQCGTVSYMAPEVAGRSVEGHSMAADWWSLGVVTYELLIGRSPFQDDSESVTDEEMSCRIITEEPYIPHDFSFSATDFISKLLVKDPRKRLGGGNEDAEELKRHPFWKTISWSEMAQRIYRAPFLPKRRKQPSASDFTDECSQMNLPELPAALHLDCDKLFRGYSYVSPSVLCSERAVKDERLQPPESCPNAADCSVYQYTHKIKCLEMKLSEAKQVQKRYDMKTGRLESQLRAAEEKIESLEAELNRVQKSYKGETRRLRLCLKDARKRISSLEQKLHEAKYLGMTETDLIAAIEKCSHWD
jgi:serine/threonine protein kinase